MQEGKDDTQENGAGEQDVERGGKHSAVSRPPRAPRPVRPQRPPRQDLDGVLLIDKPLGLSSHDVLLRVKGILRAKKAGHTGTLDPMASGLLPLCFGEATKFSQDLLDADKFYDATMRLGQRTDTGDAEGEVVQERPVLTTLADVDSVIAAFRGEIEQVPPMYSAIKRDGKPLYEYARAGQTIDREARTVSIHALERLSDDTMLRERSEVQIRVHCSKGTYIRTLAEDIGEALGCGAHLTALRRTRVGTLHVADACTLDALQARLNAASPALLSDASAAPAMIPALDPAGLMHPIDALLSSFPAVLLDEEYARRFRHGQRLRLTANTAMRWPEGQAPLDQTSAVVGRVRVYDPADRLVGTALLNAGLLAPERLVGTKTV